MLFNSFFKFCPCCGSSSFVENCIKSKQCISCGFVFYMNASAAVAALIQNEAGDLLVCTRAKEPAKGTFDLPGGFVDGDETAEQALVREVEEELQVNVLSSDYLFSLPNAYEYSGLTVPTLDLFFSCTVQTTDFKPADDVEACFFVSKSELDPARFGLSSIRQAVGIFKNSDKVFFSSNVPR